MSEYAIAFDVGGTFIKSAVLDSSGAVCRDTIDSFSAYAKGTKEEILTRLTDIIGIQANKIADIKARISGIGFAFPGPFDYSNGICYIKGGDKYDSLYGVNLRSELMACLADSPVFQRLSERFGIVFENDAALFASGEWLAGKAGQFDRCICVTIGTGTGSAFLNRGEHVRSGNGVPEGGVYAQPFRESIVDEYISRRGLLRLAAARGLPPEWDVKELADKAREGLASAVEVFDVFGTYAGEMLLPYVQAFHADGLVFGGQIAKSHTLFERTLRQALSPADVRIAFSEDTSLSTYVGVHPLLQQIRGRSGGEA